MELVNQIKQLIRKFPALVALIKKARFLVAIYGHYAPDFAKISILQTVYPYTMVGYRRLANVYDLAKKVEEDRLPGALAECGVWKGGCAAIMAFVAKKYGSKRMTWLFDSFEGLPEPTQEDGSMAKTYAGDKADGALESIDQCVGPMEEVKKILFDILRIDPKYVMLEKGWFQDTLPKAKERVGQIALLRLDGDWYESTKVCLENLYDQVVPGGYILIDDYVHWEGCKKAVDEFLQSRGITVSLVSVDETGVYFKKP